MINNYGISDFTLKQTRDKILYQRNFLENNSIFTANGQVKTLLDLSFSANHSERYYAQLANKINTMENLAINWDLEACFLTCTLDGFYRDLLQGDYTRYNKFSDEKIKEIYKSIPNNEKLGFIQDKLENEEKLTIKDLYNILNHQMRQFRNNTAFKELKKQDKKYTYIRTVEPHKDGVPHFHIMLFIPKDMIELFKKDFKSKFVAPENSKSQLDKNRRPIPNTLKGFQTDIRSASAYILKYITKSFLDIKSKRELDYMGAWFIEHRIMRCVTSRSVLPQWIFQKISLYEKDWYYLTDILESSNTDFETEWNQKEEYFYIYDNWSNREFTYFCGLFRVYSKGSLVFESGKIVDKQIIKTQIYDKTPNKWQKQLKPIPTYKDDKLISFYHNGSNYEYKKHISHMTDYELIQHYQNYDVDSNSYIKYLSIKNLLIDRNLLNEEKISLNNFKMNKFILCSHG